MDVLAAPRTGRLKPAGALLRSGGLRILVVRLSAIGDVLHTLPAVAALRKHLPDARIDWVVEDKAAALVRGNPDLDRVIVFRRKRLGGAAGEARGRRIRGSLGFVRSLRRRRYDVALDFQGNLKSGVIARLSGASVRWGFDRKSVREGNAWFTSRRLGPLPARTHRVERNLALVSALLGRPAGYAPPSLPASSASSARVDAALLSAGLPREGFAVLHPGTSGFGAFKRWPADRFARLADRIVLGMGVPVALTFGPGEEALVEAVRSKMKAKAAPLPTASLSDLAEVIRRAKFVVAADTGPLHIAAALSTPLLGLFGPKDTGVYGPYGASGPLPVLTRNDVPCRPCTLRWCPEPICMTSIDADDVFQRVQSLRQ